MLVSALCGAQIMFLGLIGEYLGQVLMETKARPLFLIRDMVIPPLHSRGTRSEQGGANSWTSSDSGH